MPEIAGMKPKEAESTLLETKKKIEEFLKQISGTIEIKDTINVGAARDKELSKGKYTISFIDFSGMSGVAPRVQIEGNGENFDIKATKLLKKLGREDEASILSELYEGYVKLRAEMEKDVEDMGIKKIEKIEDKTKTMFQRLIGLTK